MSSLRRRDRFARVLRCATTWGCGAPPAPARRAVCCAAALLLAGALLLAPNQPAAAQADAGGHPGDPWFALDHVLDVAIEMAPADWDRLRHQTRSVAGRMGGAGCLAQPFPEVFSWFTADVTVNGRRYGEVGVRKKGFRGSLDTWKPSLKIGFDKFVEGQALGGALKRITLNNSKQDASLLNTCLAYHVFAAAGLPAPRCNYARVAVNGRRFGLYAHVEDVKRSLLTRAFADAGGNLYEGNVGDFRPGLLGAIEKETNQAAGDWSEVDAVAAALQDPSPAGLKALAAAVDLDRFLTFWAAEVLVGHGDGYVNGHNNFHFYREPGRRIAFIPWGVDQTFTPGSRAEVEARGAIAHRLYRDAGWRAAYAARLRELLDTVWDETELLRRSERMAAIVQTHARAERPRARAARDADRVRRFIRERRAEILAATESEPADWPPPPPLPSPATCWGEPTSFELRFETAWGAGGPAGPFATGAVTRYLVDGRKQAVGPSGVTAVLAEPEEPALPGGRENLVVITLTAMGADSTIHGVTVWMEPHRFVDGARLVIDRAPTAPRTERWLGAHTWSVRPGATRPENVIPFSTATLELYAAGRQPGAPVSGRFSGVHWFSQPPAGAARAPTAAPSLIINEVAARGEPRDWFEIYNASGAPLALADFLLADDLTDRSRRFPFLPDLRIEPGAYLHVELDSDRWPGFALGSGEELGIWTWYGRPVAQVDWREGDSGRGTSYARVPDLTGPFRTVANPTPGAPNAGAAIDLDLAQPPIVRLRSALAALAAGERGAPAATGGAFEIRVDAAGTELTYYREPCAPGDVQGRFYLHVFPADPAELAADRRPSGFYNRSFRFAEYGVLRSGACVALVPLPAYQGGVSRIRLTHPGNHGWVEFPVGE